MDANQPTPWYKHAIAVPFGNRNYDAALGGSHNMTFAVPPNTPITSLTNDTVITDVSSPAWGKQLTVELKDPVSGHTHFSYQHLSAWNPLIVKMGAVLHYNDVIGWSGGCTAQGQYEGTHNPTGQNFCDTPEMSSQPQVGIALCDGSGYGYQGWSNWLEGRPIDASLDPMPIIDAYEKAMAPPPTDYAHLSFVNQFRSVVTDLPIDTGIFDLALEAYLSGDDHGPALGKEFTVYDKDGNPFTAQAFPMGCYWWNHNSHTGSWKPYRD